MIVDQFERDIVAALPRLKRRAARYYRNEADAEEAVQDAVEQALRSRKRPTRASVLTWMTSILYFRFLGFLKDTKYSGAEFVNLSDFADTLVTHGDPETACAHTHMLRQIANQMSPRLFAVVWRTAAGYSNEEISAEVGAIAPTVKTRLFNARRKIANLEADFV